MAVGFIGTTVGLYDLLKTSNSLLFSATLYAVFTNIESV